MRKNKYGNKKTEVDGILFDSAVEARYYMHLKGLRDAGIVKRFEMQVTYELQPAFVKDGKKYHAINYVSDFVLIYDDGRTEVVDVKGMETADFKIKKKLFEFRYPRSTLKLITFSKIDGGWIELDALKKARAKRKREKAKGEVVK